MAATFSPNCSTVSSSHHFSNKCLSPKGNQRSLVCCQANKRKGQVLWVVRSVLDNQKPVLHGNGATESTRILLERLFVRTQKLEEQISRDRHIPEIAGLGLSLEELEVDVQEDLRNAEMNVFLELNEVNHARKELERQEDEIAAVSTRKERLEKELRVANLAWASQALVIEDVKLCLRERDRQFLAAQSALSLKESELSNMSNDLIRKSEEVTNAESEVRSMAQLLHQANDVVSRQEVELRELRRSIQEKEEPLEFIMTLQQTEQDELRLIEANLKKQTSDWLIVQEELQNLETEVYKHTGEANETLEDFERVRKLLTDVRSELVSSQKAFALSKQRIGEQEQVLQEKIVELDAQRKNVLSYMKSLKYATIEIESERVKLRVSEARNNELERELAMERERMMELQKELNKERSSLEEALTDMASLKKELTFRNIEFVETENLLLVKESELVEVRLEIQHLESQLTSLQTLLEEKDSELLSAQKMFALVHEEIAELKMLMKNKHNQLFQMSVLKEKEDNVQTMKHELCNIKAKLPGAESFVERIVQPTNDLALSARDAQYSISLLKEADHKLSSYLFFQPDDDFNWQKKQLETELQLTRESLKAKEMEVLAAKRALAIKDVGLELVLSKLDNKEMELLQMKEEMNRDSVEPKTLHALEQERIGEKSIGVLAIEKLELEAAQLDVEAATRVLEKLIEMSRDLLNKASLSIDADIDVSIMPHSTSSDNRENIEENGCLAEVRNEVAKLSALTEQLVKETGVIRK